MRLDHLLGENGLINLLDIRRRYDLSVDVIDKAIKRLHVTDYDLVRIRIEDAAAAQVIELNTYPEYPTTSPIRAVKSWLEEIGESLG